VATLSVQRESQLDRIETTARPSRPLDRGRTSDRVNAHASHRPCTEASVRRFRREASPCYPADTSRRQYQQRTPARGLIRDLARHRRLACQRADGRRWSTITAIVGWRNDMTVKTGDVVALEPGIRCRRLPERVEDRSGMWVERGFKAPRTSTRVGRRQAVVGCDVNDPPAVKADAR
jgi:hypothetical protein